MAMTIFQPVTLRGNSCVTGIECAGVTVAFSPKWGMLNESKILAVISTARQLPEKWQLTASVAVGLTQDSVLVLRPGRGVAPTREIALVQEYQNGVGAKRFPEFKVDFERCTDVRVLASAHTGGGSGSESWHLVSAPLGWSSKIAAQFINERDALSQALYA